MKLTVYVTQIDNNPECQAVKTLLDFQSFHFDIVCDPEATIKHSKGRINPSAGVCVVCGDQVVGGYWNVVKWIQDNGLALL